MKGGENMFNLKKKNIKKFYVVKVGYIPIYFTNRDEALALYDQLSNSITRVKVDHVMIDKFNGVDYSGYEYLYFMGNNDEVSLTTEEKEIISQEEAEKREQEARVAKQALREKQTLADSNKK